MTLLAFIDPSWAIPANTFLLFCIAVINAWRARNVKRHLSLLSQQTVDAKNMVGANRRAEDAALIEGVKKEIQTTPPAEPRRFTDRRGE